MMKLLVVLNSMPEIFEGKTLGNIKFLNYLEGFSETKDVDTLIKNFGFLCTFSKIENNFINNNIKTADKIDLIFGELDHILSKTNNTKLIDILSGEEREDLIDGKLDSLKKMKNELETQFPRLKNLEIINKMDFNTSEEYAYYLVSLGIAYYSGFTFQGDFMVDKIGIKTSDILDPLTAFVSYSDRKRDSKGRIINGLLGGTEMVSPDSLPSQDLQVIFDLITVGHQKIRESFDKLAKPINGKTEQYYKDLGYSDLYQNVIGDTYKAHQNFYKRMEDGTLDPSMKFVNPYDDNSKLNPKESEYLKFMLWELNKCRMSLTKEELVVDYKSSIVTDIAHKGMDKYLEVPLMRAVGASKLHNLTSRGIGQSIKDSILEVRDNIDPRELTEDQRIDVGRQNKNFSKMYNQFKVSSNTRTKDLQKLGTSYFETNLERLVLANIHANLKEKILNDVLLRVNSCVVALKFYAKQSGEDITDTLEYIRDQVKTSVFDESLLSGEMLDAVKWVKVAQKITSNLTIPFRPAMLIKELTMGTIANVSRAFTQVYGDNSFNIKHLTEAYKIMMSVDNKMSKSFNIVDSVNYNYGIVNLDQNTLVQKNRTDRAGVMNTFSKYMYATATYGDYVNRMTLFIAQMIHDGVWDAHSNDENGLLIYDFKKDKRFDEYLKYKDNKNYSSEKFLQQRSLYRKLIEQFNIEGYRNSKGEILKFGDDLPQAYTIKDKESLKSFSDMAYGYYDDERKSLVNKTAFGIIFMQFQTFWTAKKRLWLTKPNQKNVRQGHWAAKFITDENGNKQPVYLKIDYDENGEPVGTQEVLENPDGTLEQVTNWIGHPSEGLFYALAHTTRDLVHLRFKDAFADKNRNKKSALALHDILASMFYAFIGAALTAQLRSATGARTPEQIKASKSKQTFVEMIINNADTAANKAFREFGPQNLYGNFSWTPAFASKVTGLTTGAYDVFFQDASFKNYAKKHLKLLENFNIETDPRTQHN